MSRSRISTPSVVSVCVSAAVSLYLPSAPGAAIIYLSAAISWYAKNVCTAETV